MGRRTKTALSPEATCELFVRRVQHLCHTEMFAIGAWRISGDGDPTAGHLPSRAQLIEFLTFFRQFFLHANEPVAVRHVISALRKLIHDQELLEALAVIETTDPFAFFMRLETGGRRFDLRELTEAFVSKYFHADQIPAEIADDGHSWQVQLFPLSLAFERGVKIVCVLRDIIVEANQQGTIHLAGLDRALLSTPSTDGRH